MREADALFSREPNRLAARLRPRIARKNGRWRVEEEKTGTVGIGWSLERAVESWEANYREATTAQQ